MDYSQIEANAPHTYIKIETVAAEAEVNHRDKGYNEGFCLRAAS
ncbi:MAG: hypothetical protein PVH84_04730 [Candidatus Aminicenantes bacterium]|jgi:hypothetical protein